MYRLSWWLSGKELACNARDVGSIPGSGRSPGDGNDNLLQYSCLKNAMGRGAWQATDHEAVKSQTRPSNSVGTYSITSKFLGKEHRSPHM